MKHPKLVIYGILLFSITFGVNAKNNVYPGRDIFSDVPIVELQDLYKHRDQVVIVDARSKIEYNTLRIRGAVNIPLGSKSFASNMKKLRASTSKPIVFYCNGRTCLTSYRAVRKARLSNVDQCYAYDAGVFDWTKAYPHEAVLLGRSPVKIADLINEEKFKAHLLSPEEFERRVSGGSVIVLDVRDYFQRDAVGFFPGLERKVSLDDRKKLNRYINQAKIGQKEFLIYDAVGKQVRWLQYFLEQAGVEKYYFMEGGAKRYYDMLAHNNWD